MQLENTQIVYFLRHATAEEPGPGLVDGERQLIDKGYRQCTRVAAFIQRNNLIIECVLSSPLIRAEQTAKSIIEVMKPSPVLEVQPWLSLAYTSVGAGQELAQLLLAGAKNILLVGHEPNLSVLISTLLGSERELLVVKKASLTALRFTIQPEVSGARPAQINASIIWSLPNSLM